MNEMVVLGATAFPARSLTPVIVKTFVTLGVNAVPVVTVTVVSSAASEPLAPATFPGEKT